MENKNMKRNSSDKISSTVVLMVAAKAFTTIWRERNKVIERNVLNTRNPKLKVIMSLSTISEKVLETNLE